jgi:transcriptional regulator with XRE-family HTH domain
MQTIGERLEEARKKKGVSIREAAEATKIRGDYLQKFESNQFDIGLTEIYTRGFLRTYANFLKLPAERLLNDYAALGRGEVRPRQPSREIYGRMDISVAHAESGDRGGASTEAAPAEPSPQNRGPSRSRSGSSLPTGPDPAVVFKYLKIGGIAVAALVVVFLIITWWPSKRGGSPRVDSPAVVNGPTFGLIATGPVKVTLRRKNADDSEGEFVFASTLAAGERKLIPWTNELYVEAVPPQNLEVDLSGRRFNLAASVGAGVNRGLIPPPPVTR